MPIHRDVLFTGFELQFRRRFHPLGFPFELETNSVEVIRAASEGWGAFAPAFNETPVRLCLAVSDAETPLLTPKSAFASREHLMSMYGDAENFMVFDFQRCFAFGCVTRGTAADHPLVRYRFLMPALMLVEQQSLAPLHGALIVKNGRGVMLGGDTLAGKSTLAYAACRAGWAYVTDDGVSLVRARSDRYAVGDYTSIRLREDARRFFPELAGHLSTVRPNGKVAIEILTRRLPMDTLPGHSVDHVVFLDRQESGPASMRRYSPEQALARWELYRSFGESEVRGAQLRSHQRLLETGSWEMRYSRLEDAIECLDQLVSGLEAA
ncbi:MAG TPA: hypothetical protein VMH05_20620 [Bryobacteraceae bacterium]|nr:hypothetical protein [Bryobacteraceae bacterium]